MTLEEIQKQKPLYDKEIIKIFLELSSNYDNEEISNQYKQIMELINYIELLEANFNKPREEIDVIFPETNEIELGVMTLEETKDCDLESWL